MPALWLLLALGAVASAMFYLPGVAPSEYMQGAPVEVKVIKLDSAKTLLPYAYYALPYCKPKEGVQESIDNLGEILVGDRIENSAFDVQALKNTECAELCTASLSKEDMERFRSFIADDYRAHMMVDNLPAAYDKGLMRVDSKSGKETELYSEGFPVGKLEDVNQKSKLTKQQAKAASARLHNHLRFVLSYNAADELAKTLGPVRIVKFEVIPMSSSAGCGTGGPIVILGNGAAEATKVKFTYSVQWKPSTVTWATRWDIFLQDEGDDQIHWFSIVNSVMIVLFLTGIVAIIMLKTVSADFRKYRELETQEEAQEETGWKLVHGDVFRPPAHEMLLSVFVGNGVQILTMTGVTLVVALLGFLSPANRGALLTAMLVLYALMGLQAGYVSARLYKMLKGTQWKRNTVQTAILIPAICLGTFFCLNLALWYQESSAAVGFLRLLMLAFLWIGVSVPLVFAGAYYGYKKDAIEPPCKVNQIPRQVPPQVWYTGPIASVLMGGVLPFGAIFIELFFILSSL